MEISRCPSPATIASKLNAIIKSPVKGHSCDFRTCDIENLSVEIHKLNGKFVILCKYIKPPEGISKDTLYKTIYSIYLCRGTCACVWYNRVRNRVINCIFILLIPHRIYNTIYLVGTK